MLIAAIVCGCSSETNKLSLLERARRDFEAGRYDNARIEYLNVLRMDPQNTNAIQQLGIIWFEEGAPLRALPFLLKAREVAPSNLNCRTKLVIALKALGQVSDAKKEALAVLGQDPTNGDAIILLADTAQTPHEVDETQQKLQKFTERNEASFCLASASLFIRKGDLASAKGEIQRALALDRNLASAHLAMAGLLLLQANSTRADEELKTAAELGSIRSGARLKYAEFKAQTGAVDEAKAILKEVTGQAPDYLPVWGCLAKLVYGEKRYSESLSFLENIFNRDPLNLEGRLLQSEVWLANGETNLALEGLNRLNEAYPRIPVVKYQLARAYLQNHSPVQAIVALNQALALNPEYVDAILLMGETNLRAGDASPVVASMQDLLKKHPALMRAQILLAAAFQSLGQLDDAAAIFREQIRVSPGSAQSHLGFGMILREQGKMAQARTAFEKAQKLEPQNQAAVQQLVELDILSHDFNSASLTVARQLEETPRSADAHFLEGKLHAARGEWDHAETALLKTLELDPNYSSAYDLLISTYIASDKLTQAIDKLNSLLSKDPNNVRLLMLSGLINDKLKQFQQAGDAYEKLLSLRPDFAPALNNLAYLYAERLNKLDKAYDLARKARALQPDDAATADTLGWILYRRADYDQALTLLKKSAHKFPKNLEIQFHLGMACYMMGQIEAARTALSQATDAQSDFPGKQEAERRLALLGDGSGKTTDLSREQLEAILQRQPEDVIARLFLGETYERQGEFAKAAAAYEKAIKVNPRLFRAMVKLARLYAGPLGNTDKAAEFGRKARELAPNDPRVDTNVEGSSL